MMDRRNFLKWGAAGIAGAVIGNPKKLDEPKLGEDEDTDSAEKRLEQKEEWKSEHFQKAVKGHAVAFGELTNEELLFFMPDGSPLSKKRLDPISSEEGGVINVFEQTQRGRKFNQKWLDEMRKLVCKENVNKIGEYEKSTGINVLDVEKYLPAQITFSRLISSAKEYREEIETFLDVAFYNGANIMPNDLQNRSRIQYIKEEIGSNIDKNLPETIRDELIELTPGLCALESGYDPQATSSANAKGVFHFWVVLLRKWEVI